MKKTAVLLMCMAILLTGCVDSRREERQVRKIQEESGEAMDVTAKYLENEARDARKALEAGIKDLDREIERLNKKSGQAAEDAKPEVDRRQANLEVRKADARKQREKAGDATAGNWDEFKRDFRVFQGKMKEALDDSRTN